MTCALAAAAFGGGGSRASAQGRYSVEAFEPALQVKGSVLNLYGGRTLEPGGFSVALFGSYADEPLRVEGPGGEDIGALVGDVGSAQLLAAVGLFERVDLGVGVSLHHTGRGDSFGAARLDAASLQGNQLSFGDVRLTPRVSLVRHEGRSGVNLALLAPMWLPTGDDSAYAGESFRIEPRVALDYQSEAVLLVLNAGYMIRSTQPVVTTEADDQVKVGVGADVRVAGGLGVLGTVDSRFNVLASDFGDKDIDTELLLGLRYQTPCGFRAQLGAGPGLSHALTAPTYRVFAGVSYAREPRKAQMPVAVLPQDVITDSDGDGIPDARDRCPHEAEDTDGFEDEDGCPEADNDGDGIGDHEDDCPEQAEDVDGFQDDDGCPDLDNDGDGIPDTEDRCPLQAGTADHGGCAAPQAPEPAAAPAALDLSAVVRFERGSAEISSGYAGSLDAIASQLAEHPEVQRVAIEGHADDSGAAVVNTRLARERAQAVRAALIERGVDKQRLVAKGFGSSRPTVANDSEEHRAQNRRVELRVTSRAAQP